MECRKTYNYPIGNDIPITWRIKRFESSEDLSRAVSLKLQMIGSNGIAINVTGYTLDGNAISWIFRGKDQTTPASYVFKLVGNEGLDNMFTVKTCAVLRLVPAVCMSDNPNGVLPLDITSEIVVPSNGLSAYEIAVLHGFKGTEEEWLDSLKQPAEDVAEKAQETIKALAEASNKATEAANAAAAAADKAVQAVTELGNRLAAAETTREEAESARVRAELLRVQAENARAQAELLRDSAERQRAAAEELRVRAEQLRVAAEQARAAAEEKRVTAEQSRADAEAARVKAETARVGSETARVKAEEARVTAETSRVQAEESRVTAEEQREETFATLKSDAEKATKDATDAAMLAQENVLAIEFDQSTGTLSAVVGADNSAFTSGEITSDGEVVLDFDYEVTD